jgi:hypothetical protein
VLPSPFFTDLDQRAAVKGSRDPLGIQPIWTWMGRHLVGNLTTVSTQVRDFTSLLLGYHFAERLAEEGRGEEDLATFLKWEQLAAYARVAVCGEQDGIRGVERVRRNLGSGERVSLGVDPACQILGNQKIYGLWGLYTVPGRSSGLLEGAPTRLTSAARDLVNKVYLPTFTRHGARGGDRIADALAEKKARLGKDKHRDNDLLRAVAAVFPRRRFAEEKRMFREHLLLGGPLDDTKGAQAVIAAALESTFGDDAWALSPAAVRALAKEARGQGDLGAHVAFRLERIRTCELLVAPAGALFDFLLTRDGRSIRDTAADVRSRWGDGPGTIDVEATALLESEIAHALGDPGPAARWVALSRALAAGRYEEAIVLALDHNRHVMSTRGGSAPWIDRKEGQLVVRFRGDDAVPLPARNTLPSFWRYSYFLDSLRAVALALRD